MTLRQSRGGKSGPFSDLRNQSSQSSETTHPGGDPCRNVPFESISNCVLRTLPQPARRLGTCNRRQTRPWRTELVLAGDAMVGLDLEEPVKNDQTGVPTG